MKIKCYNENMKHTIQPNTTQTPNLIFDVWMPQLSDAELRVLLVIVRQTLGWVEDAETGRRKEKDWISRSQLVMKTGKGKVAVSGAVKNLIEKHQLIEALNSKGKLLDTAEKRMKIGAGGRIYYRLNIHAPLPTLFDEEKPIKQGRKAVQKVNPSQKAVQKKAPFFLNPTKETYITKESIHTMQQAKPVASEKSIKKGNPDHKKFLDFWHETVPRTRGIKPIYTQADMRNLKRILDFGIQEQTLEQIALFFLADYRFKQFSPSISTLCSSGIINGLLNRSTGGNDPEFWKSMDRYMRDYLNPITEKQPDRKKYDPEDASTFSTMTTMQDAMKKLLDRYNQNTLEKSPRALQTHSTPEI